MRPLRALARTLLSSVNPLEAIADMAAGDHLQLRDHDDELKRLQQRIDQLRDEIAELKRALA